MLKKTNIIVAMFIALFALSFAPANAQVVADATNIPEANFGNSTYIGWDIYQVAHKLGIMDSVATAHGVRINFIHFDDYITSVNQITNDDLQFVTVTNLDAFNMPAAAGKKCETVTPGDISLGNDAVLARAHIIWVTDEEGNLIKTNIADKKRKVFLVEASLSEYIWEYFLEKYNLPADSFEVINASDKTIGANFVQDPTVDLVVTWNPHKALIEFELAGVKNLYNTSFPEMNGFIQDMIVGNSTFLKQYPQFGEALADLHFVIMDRLFNEDPTIRAEFVNALAELNDITPFRVEYQLKTTGFFKTPAEAANFINGQRGKDVMMEIAKFSDPHGYIGTGLKWNDVGVKWNVDGFVQGKKTNIGFIYTDKWVNAIADRH